MDEQEYRNSETGEMTEAGEAKEVLQMPEPGKKKPKKAKSFGSGILTGILITLGTLVVVGGIAVFLLMRRYPSMTQYTNTTPEYVPSGDARIDVDNVADKLDLLQEYVSAYYLFDEDPKTAEDGIYKGFITSLGDPYSTYYNSKEYNDMMDSSNGEYSGIGALLSQDKNTRIMTILRVFEGSPAEEAGVEAGDIIYKVDGEDVTALDLDVVTRTYIRGPENTEVVLTLLRGDRREEMEFHITRRTIEVPTVEWEMLEDSIGYIQVTEFDEVTVNQYKKAIDDLTAQGMKGLVVDMRDNPGGLVNSAISMLDYTLPDGLYTYTADKTGVGNRYYGNDHHEVNVPMAVLMNAHSASAAEIYAGAVQDFGRDPNVNVNAVLVGEKSFGKGIIQSVFPIGDGSAIKLTTMHYYTPSGFDLHGEGLEPDIQASLVPEEEEGKEDSSDTASEDAEEEEAADGQLDAALAYLLEQIGK